MNGINVNLSMIETKAHEQTSNVVENIVNFVRDAFSMNTIFDSAFCEHQSKTLSFFENQSELNEYVNDLF